MRKSAVIFVALQFILLTAEVPGFAQTLTGTLRGVALDQQGRVIANATVTLTEERTNVSAMTRTSSAGVYTFSDLPVGSYTLKVEAPAFAAYIRGGITVRAAQITDATANLTVGPANTQVRVESGADVVQTQSSQLSGTFDGDVISDVPIATGANLSVLNFSLFLPNTTAAAGGTSGTGGAVGGLRGRQNSFTIDGVDNNDPDVTAAAQPVIPDAVQEFTLNQNVFSAEYGRGSGGQFGVITKTGTNQLHFDAWAYNGNRAYDASTNQEQANIAAGVQTGKSRYDFNRVGGDIGGPIARNKLFLYGAYEFNNLGGQATAASGLAPTAAGMATLQALAVDSQVKAILAQLPVAPVKTSSVTVNPQTTPVSIPIGTVNSVAPSYNTQSNIAANGDWILNPQQTLHIRYVQSRNRSPLFGSFPQAQFAASTATDDNRVTVNDVWTPNGRMVNDFKISYARFDQFYTLPGAGQVAQNYPTVGILDLGGTVFGPSTSFPGYRIYNEYLLGDTFTWTKGRHTLKWGGQFYWYIAPSVFLQDQRGQYGYRSLSQLVNDQIPNYPGFSLQGIGNGFFSDNSKNFNLFVQDDIKINRRLTLNLGLRYDVFGNPASAKLNALNAIANLPGTPLVFGVPKQDWNNVGPRVGLAWDPTGSGKWAIRSGAGVVYDVVPWNFFSNGLPVEVQDILNPTSACQGTFGPAPSWCTTNSGFLANGAMNIPFVPPTTTSAARALTSQEMPNNAIDPKVFSWSLDVQHEISHNTRIEVRYLGTRALELPVQFELNAITAFQNGALPLPTYINPSSIPGTVAATAPTLAQFLAAERFRYAAQGFTGGPLVQAAPVGASTYHGGSIELLHRFGHGLFLRANYTHSKTMDDATNDLDTSAVDPRRPQDPYDLKDEWADSALDVPDKVAMTFLYDTPTLHADKRFVRVLLNGWQWGGSFLFQSGQPITIQSGDDANGNLDSAGDRAILNPNGVQGVGSLVTPVCRNPATGTTSVTSSCTPPNIVGWAANNPNAEYIQAQLGAVPNLGRNTYRSPHLNVWNMAIFKNSKLSERVNMQFRVQAFDVFNHPNFTLANLSVFPSSTGALNTGYASLTGVASGTFLNALVFNGGSRQVELGVKISY